MKVTALVTRAGRWLEVEVPEFPGVFTQTRVLSEVRAMVAEAVSLALEIPEEDVEVEVALLPGQGPA